MSAVLIIVRTIIINVYIFKYFILETYLCPGFIEYSSFIASFFILFKIKYLITFFLCRLMFFLLYLTYTKVYSSKLRFLVYMIILTNV